MYMVLFSSKVLDLILPMIHPQAHKTVVPSLLETTAVASVKPELRYELWTKDGHALLMISTKDGKLDFDTV